MPRSLFQWLPAYQTALNEARNVGHCLAVLEKGWDLTEGLGEEWPRALALSLNAGFIEGCRWLLERGITPAKPRRGEPDTLRRASSLSARLRTADAAHLPADACVRPNGEPSPPLSGISAVRAVEVFCRPPAAPVAPEHLSVLAGDGHWAVLTQILQTGHVAPWGGARSAAAVRDLFEQSLKPTVRGSAAIFRGLAEAIVAGPPGRLLKKAADLPGVLLSPLACVSKVGSVVLKPLPENPNPLVESMSVLTGLGFSIEQIAESYRHSRAGQPPHDLQLIALVHNAPQVFGSLRETEILWHLRSTGAANGAHTDVLTWLARRINACDGSALALREQWWSHALALGTLEKGQTLLQRKNMARPVVWRRPIDAERWDSLHRSARLANRPEEASPVTTPRRARL